MYVVYNSLCIHFDSMVTHTWLYIQCTYTIYSIEGAVNATFNYPALDMNEYQIIC